MQIMSDAEFLAAVADKGYPEEVNQAMLDLPAREASSILR